MSADTHSWTVNTVEIMDNKLTRFIEEIKDGETVRKS